MNAEEKLLDEILSISGFGTKKAEQDQLSLINQFKSDICKKQREICAEVYWIKENVRNAPEPT